MNCFPSSVCLAVDCFFLCFWIFLHCWLAGMFFWSCPSSSWTSVVDTLWSALSGGCEPWAVSLLWQLLVTVLIAYIVLLTADAEDTCSSGFTADSWLTSENHEFVGMIFSPWYPLSHCNSYWVVCSAVQDTVRADVRRAKSFFSLLGRWALNWYVCVNSVDEFIGELLPCCIGPGVCRRRNHLMVQEAQWLQSRAVDCQTGEVTMMCA